MFSWTVLLGIYFFHLLFSIEFIWIHHHPKFISSYYFPACLSKASYEYTVDFKIARLLLLKMNNEVLFPTRGIEHNLPKAVRCSPKDWTIVNKWGNIKLLQRGECFLKWPDWQLWACPVTLSFEETYTFFSQVFRSISGVIRGQTPVVLPGPSLSEG